MNLILKSGIGDRKKENSMIHNIINHLYLRRRWNRTKRWMRDRAYSRAMADIYMTGKMYRRV